MSPDTRKRKRRGGRLHLPDARVLGSGGRIGLLLGGAFIVALAYLMGMNRTLEQAARLEALQERCEAVEREVERLQLDVAAELAGERVVALARERLGMDFPVGSVERLAVLPEACGSGGGLRTYFENAFAIALEGVGRTLVPVAFARETAPPDTSGGGLP